jgi:hypothetical protein
MRGRAWIAAVLALCPVAAGGAEYDMGGDVRLRWDNTVRTSLGLRLSPQDPALLADPNADDGDRAFTRGPISERVDILSQFDLSQGDLGVDASADGWYDAAYHGRDANTSPASFNPLSVPNDRFPQDVRALQGGTAELLTAYVHDRVVLDGLPVTVKVGRQTLLWGESLFATANGIAAGQAPVDRIKALSQPLAEARELFLPVAQVVGSVQLSPGVDVEAYVQPEWRRDRLPGVASYFSTTDFLDVGGQRLLVGSSYLSRERDRTPSGLGQFGLALHLTSGDTDFGAYALRFDARSPQIFVTPNGAAAGPLLGSYGLVYPRGIEVYGISASGYLGDSNVAGEVSLRRHMPLASILPPLSGPDAARLDAATPYAAGDTLHGQVSMVSTLPPGRFWQGATLQAELSANDRLEITRDPASLAPGRDRFATALRVAFTPQYFEVLPHLELTVPIGFGLNLSGNSSVAGSGQAHAGDVDLGLGLTWRVVWRGALNYTRFVGSAARQPLADRDFLALTLTRTF